MKPNSLVYLGLLILFLTACNSQKNAVYFQGKINSKDLNLSYSPTFKPDDLLSITVMGNDEEAVKPFNLTVNLNSQNSVGGYNIGNQSLHGYLITSDGYIDFPVIGKIKLGGLTRSLAIDLLKENLVPYLKNPIVFIRILNYKVTILGEVKNPGTFNIPNERITLLEAIGIAGDLQISAVRKNILVVRDDNGKKTETRVDLTSNDIFSSPVYYLQQNDLVYVEPSRTKINSLAVNPANISLITSFLSLLITMAILLK